MPRTTSPVRVGISYHLFVRRSGMEVQYFLIPMDPTND